MVLARGTGAETLAAGRAERDQTSAISCAPQRGKEQISENDLYTSCSASLTTCGRASASQRAAN
eukprot:5359312-Pleurochrysis_carterae.AAC.1